MRGMTSLDRASRYEELKQRLRGGTSSSVAEDTSRSLQPALPPLDENLVQAIWHEQLLHTDQLKTLTGQTVQVHDPGQWNSGAGPDFRNADLVLGDQHVRGDIEIHLVSSDWERHNHHRDFDYNRVVLHVVLTNDDGRRTDDLHNGSRIERLELTPYLNPDMDTIRRSLAGEDFLFSDRTEGTGSTCHEAVARVAPELLHDFFHEAARQRMESKIARFAAQRVGSTLDQVLYQAVMTSMGHKGGKTLFFLLSKRVPLEELKQYMASVPLPQLPLALESVLLHVAQLAQPTRPARKNSGTTDLLSPADESASAGACSGELLDEETLTYLDRLHCFWSQYSGYYQDRILPPTRRWFGSVRPVNFPTRRIAGVARLLSNFDFRRGLVSTFVSRLEDSRARQPKTSRDFKREIAQLSLLFAAQGDSYWSRHYTIGGRPSPRSMQLIGDDRALSVLYNALLPMTLLYAREEGKTTLEEYVWRLHEHFPALPENTVTRYMRHRLFGVAGSAPGITFRFEKHNQALFQVFQECCSNTSLTCEDCIFRAQACAPFGA